MAEGKKQLQEMRIRPAENGGHTVTHEYKRQMVNRGGSMKGGLDYEYPRSEDHVFGPEDGDKLMSHISKHLHITSAAPEPPEDGAGE